MYELPKYIVSEKQRHEAYNMKDVQAIVSGLMRQAKEDGRTTLTLTIDIK